MNRRNLLHRIMRYQDGSTELYNLTTDPSEKNNLANTPEVADLEKQLLKKLTKLTD